MTRRHRRLASVAPVVLATGGLMAVASGAAATPTSPSGIPALGNASRVIMVEARSPSSTRATVSTFTLEAGVWQPKRAGMAARLGYHGLSQPSRRREGDGTTPMGVYSIVYGFGSRPNPGMTGFKWRRTNPLACWSSTRLSYNRWVARRPCFAPDENLWTGRNGTYRYAAVLDFNYARPVYGKGSAIFLHVMRRGHPTAGCVSLAERDLTAVLRWVKPGTRVLIGTTAVLTEMKAA